MSDRSYLNKLQAASERGDIKTLTNALRAVVQEMDNDPYPDPYVRALASAVEGQP